MGSHSGGSECELEPVPRQDGHTVLLVEDEGLVRLVIAEELRLAGFRVLEAANALDALAILAACSVDAVLTDVRMPGGLDGLDLAAAARELYPSVKIVAMSGHLPAGHRDPRVHQFLFKPFDLAEAVDTLMELLGPQRS